jgi:hypothetical protein
MKLSNYILGGLFAVGLVAVLALLFNVPERPAATKGATIYDPAKEVVVKGAVEKVWDFACPESNGEVGRHLLLRTSQGHMQVHLAPVRMMRRQPMTLAVGDQIEVVGSQVRVWDRNDMLAREITRDTEIMVLRDRQGNLLLDE